MTCADCGRDFNFSEREQEFHREKGFKPPKRCKDCRSEPLMTKDEFERYLVAKGIIAPIPSSDEDDADDDD